MTYSIRVACSVLCLFLMPMLAHAQFVSDDLAIADSFSGAGIVNRDSSNITELYGDFPAGALGSPGKLVVRDGIVFVQSLDDIFRFAVVGAEGELFANTSGGISAILSDNQTDELIVCTAENLTWYDVGTGDVVEVVSDGLSAPQDILQLDNGDILIIDTANGLLRLDNDRNLTTVNDSFSFGSLDQMTLGLDGFLYISQARSAPMLGYSLFQMDLNSGATIEVDVLDFEAVLDLATDVDGKILFGGRNVGTLGGLYFYDPISDQQGTIIEENKFSVAGVTVVDDPGILLGDANQDGNVNLLDIDPFVTTILVSSFCLNSDINRDGMVNLLDVEPFVFLITIQ